MLTKFKNWYFRNQTRINWFLIGWLSFGGIMALARNDYIDAALCFAFVVLNVIFDRK